MRGDARLIEHLKAVSRAQVFLPQPVLAEIEYGLSRLTRSKRKEALVARFELLKSEIARAIWSDEVSADFGRAKATLEKRGERIDDFDVAVAAHALAHGSVLVTANVKHHARVPGLLIEDWSV